MRRIVVVSSLAVVLIPLLVASAAWLPSSTIEQEKGSVVIAPAPTASPTTAIQNKQNRQASLSPAPVAPAPKAELAQVDWKPFPTDIPGLGTLLAGACLVLPFAFSMWATLRKTV